MSRKITYDGKCYDLAEYFLADDGTLSTSRADGLAGCIQLAIEDWLAMNPANRVTISALKTAQAPRDGG